MDASKQKHAVFDPCSREYTTNIYRVGETISRYTVDGAVYRCSVRARHCRSLLRIDMNVFAFAVLPFLAAVQCHVLVDYFANPKGCAADVPVARNYRHAFQERNRVFPTYERVLKIFENGYTEMPREGDETATVIECGGDDGDETWAQQSLDCMRKLKKEMNLVVTGMLSFTAAELGRLTDEYIDRSLELLDAYATYVSETPEAVRPTKLPAPFDYLMFEKPHETARCALRFLFDGGDAEIDAIYRKYAFFVEDSDAKKNSMGLVELRSSVSSLSERSRDQTERDSERSSTTRVGRAIVVSGSDESRKDVPAAEPTSSKRGDGPVRTVFDVINPFKEKLRHLEDELLKFSKPFCEQTAGWSHSAMKWSFLKNWPFYDQGFYYNKSLKEHVALLGGKVSE